MAREGSMGILHWGTCRASKLRRARSSRDQARPRAARSSGPVTAPAQPESLRSALEGDAAASDISSVPIVIEGDRPVGILTARDIRFEQNLDQSPDQRAHDQGARSQVPPGVGVDKAKRIFHHQHRIEKLLVVGARRPARRELHHPSRTSWPGRPPAGGQGRAAAPARRCRNPVRGPASTSAPRRPSSRRRSTSIIVDTATPGSQGVGAVRCLVAQSSQHQGHPAATPSRKARATDALIDAGADAGPGQHRARRHLRRRAWRRRRRGAAESRPKRLRGGPATSTACPSSPAAASSTRATWPRPSLPPALLLHRRSARSSRAFVSRRIDLVLYQGLQLQIVHAAWVTSAP